MAHLTELQHRDKARRREGVVLATGLVALVVAGSVWAVSSFSRDSSPVIPDETPPPSSTAPQLLDYTTQGDGIGVEITEPSQVDRLTGAPETFKTFVAGLVTTLKSDATCADAFHGVTVQKVRTDGFAVGGVNSCGGYVALWAVVDGSWKEVEGAQELWDCKVLRQYSFPSDVAGDACYDYSGTNKREAYHQP